MPKGAGWKTSVVSRVSVLSIVPQMSLKSEGMLLEMIGPDRHVQQATSIYVAECARCGVHTPQLRRSSPKYQKWDSTSVMCEKVLGKKHAACRKRPLLTQGGALNQLNKRFGHEAQLFSLPRRGHQRANQKKARAAAKLELELIQSHMAQKPVLPLTNGQCCLLILHHETQAISPYCIATALKKYNGGRVFAFVMGAAHSSRYWQK